MARIFHVYPIRLVFVFIEHMTKPSIFNIKIPDIKNINIYLLFDIIRANFDTKGYFVLKYTLPLLGPDRIREFTRKGMVFHSYNMSTHFSFK